MSPLSPSASALLRRSTTSATAPRAGRWVAALQVAGFSALALGCTVAPASDDADAEKGSTHAVVAVSREDSLDAAPRGDALAGFVQLPPSADRSAALELAGLGLEVPEAGQCSRKSQERPASSLSGVSRIEFLDAGRVQLVAGSAEPHTLAPHAFPTIADFISGVVYASRDQSGEGLPPAQLYRIETSSDGYVGALSAEQAAPNMPAEVTLSGSDFASSETLKSGQPLDLTWSVSSDPGDRFYVELSSARGDSGVVCAFDDTAGAGTVPTEGYAAGDETRLAVHRLRLVRTTTNATNETVDLELRFDFSVSRSIRFE